MDNATVPQRQKSIHFLPGYDSLSFEEKRCAQVLVNMKERNDTDINSIGRRLDRSQFVTQHLVFSVLSKVRI